MENRKLGIILIILGLLLLGGIIYFLFFFNFEEDIQVLTNSNSGPEQVVGLAETEDEEEEDKRIVKEITINKDSNAQPAGEAEVRATELKKMAMSFTERFGSYSNHSDFSNITDLKIFMTEDMKSWADNFVEVGRRGLGDDPDYQGVMTRAVTAEVKDYDLGGGTAQILVEAKKTFSDSDTNETEVRYENMLVTFAKEGREWKIDNAEWQERN